jgi:hypothetical protein
MGTSSRTNDLRYFVSLVTSNFERNNDIYEILIPQTYWQTRNVFGDRLRQCDSHVVATKLLDEIPPTSRLPKHWFWTAAQDFDLKTVILINELCYLFI